MKTNRSWLKLGCSILILLGLLNVIEIGFLGLGYYLLDLQARSNISTRLGIEPNWDSLRYYIPDHITVGMSRIDVIEESEKIGAFVIVPVIIHVKYCEDYIYNVGPLHSSRGGRWDICYDNNDIVTSVEEFLYR
jgi:hypothetical protein